MPRFGYACSLACSLSGHSGCPSTTCRPGPSTTASANSIEAHLTIVFAALAISRWIEHQTGWSIRKFVLTARRYRTIKIQVGQHVITAADPVPDEPPRNHCQDQQRRPERALV